MNNYIMADLFGNQYNLISFIVFLILGVLGIIFTLKKISKKLTFYFEGLSFFNTDFTSRISKFILLSKEIEINPLKDYLTFTCYVQNTGNTDLIKSDFTDSIKFNLGKDVSILDFTTTDYPGNIKSSINNSAKSEIEIEFELLKKGEIIKILLLLEVDKTDKLRILERKLLKDLVFSYRGINFRKHEFILALKRTTQTLYYQLILYTAFYSVVIIFLLYSWHIVKTRSSYDVINLKGETYKGDILLLRPDTVRLYDVRKDSIFEFKVDFKDTSVLNNFRIENIRMRSIFSDPSGIVMGVLFLMIYFMPFIQFAGQIKYKRRIERVAK